MTTIQSIVFSGDNGDPTGHDREYIKDKKNTPTIAEFFNAESPTRGQKGDGYDGAFHIPALVRWPHHIAPGQVSDFKWAFWDFLPTAADIAGVKPPADIDGVSILPTLIKKGTQKIHEYFYWEFEQSQAVRYGKWFGHRKNGGNVELYDLIEDPLESTDLAEKYPDVAHHILDIMTKEHTPSDVWPSPGESQEDFEKRLKAHNVPERPNNLSVY